ncbi:MAG: GGDEF domain-containing protein [Actinobacteria bacterium]|nr:GGDEF domain-containing protein [Actinomycetota bacterium]
MSLQLKTTAVVALALGAFFYVATYWIDFQSSWQLAAAVLILFAVVALTFDLWVYRPLNALIRRARQRLGGNYERNDPYYRDETRELGHLVGTLIAVFTAAEDKEWVSQSIKADLERMRALNRQLMDVGELGKEMNAALPYRETVERVLSRSKAFLHADFAALLLLDADARAFSLEGAQGVLSPTISSECCAFSPDCPVRQAIASGHVARTTGHTCTLFPHTMKDQLVIPVHVENIGDMAVLATSTSGEYVALLSDDILVALQNHVQSALTNAHKYDAIRRQVVTDHLTHLYNRRYFMNRAGEEIERSLRHQHPLSVLMVDIDHFKEFNDTYGHATGDRVLQTVARAMQDALRKPDICARHGGEEFAVLLPNTPGENAYYVAERVRRTLSGTRYTGLGLPAAANITISVGVATCPRDATDLDALMELADKALYRAKAAGRDQVVLHGAEQRDRVRN